MKIIGIGDNVFDNYLREKKLYPGGNSVNVPVLAMRAGASAAAYIGILGDDAPGRHFLRALRDEGVDTSRVRVMHGTTAQNHIHNDDSGDRHFVGNNGQEVAEAMVGLQLVPGDHAFIQGYDLAHTSVHSFIESQLPGIARRAPLSMDFSDGYNYRNIPQLCPLLRFAFFSGGDKSHSEVRELAAFALEQMDEAIADPAEVERRLGLPILFSAPTLMRASTRPRHVGHFPAAPPRRPGPRPRPPPR